MELCDMDLEGFMKEELNRALDKLFNIAQQAARGIYILHDHDPPIVHRDIKPQNILIKCDGVTSEITIKIADFGISSSADESELIR